MCASLENSMTLQWRHNEHDAVSNHQPHDCYSIFYSSADQRKHQRYTSLAFVWGIHRWPVNSPHKGPVTRKMFPFDDVIMRTFEMQLLQSKKTLNVCFISRGGSGLPSEQPWHNRPKVRKLSLFTFSFSRPEAGKWLTRYLFTVQLFFNH